MEVGQHFYGKMTGAAATASGCHVIVCSGWVVPGYALSLWWHQIPNGSGALHKMYIPIFRLYPTFISM